MLPTQKTSKCSKRKRRSHHALTPSNLSPCPKCGRRKLPHGACDLCGYVSSKVALPRDED